MDGSGRRDRGADWYGIPPLPAGSDLFGFDAGGSDRDRSSRSGLGAAKDSYGVGTFERLQPNHPVPSS